MPNFYEIPLSPDPQMLRITLSGVEYQLTVRYRATGSGWILDIADAGGAPIIGGLPLVTGTDVLGQYAYLGLGGRIWVQGADNPDNVPTFDNLGVSSHVFWVTD